MFVVRRGRPRGPEVAQPEVAAVFRTMVPATGTQSGRSSQDAPRWRPPIEVYETDEALVVRAEVAGIDDTSLEVTVDGDRLAIRGERPDRCRDERRSYHEARIPYGAFGADVYIPFPVDPDATEAEYQNGFLRIVLPRRAARTIVARRFDRDGERGEGAR